MYLLRLILIQILLISLVKSNNLMYNKNNNILNDLPQKTDLVIYLRALCRIVEYFRNNKFEIDLNVHMGLFFMNVNLRAARLHTEYKNDKINYNILSDIIKQNDDLINYFNSMVKELPNIMFWDTKNMVERNYNQSNWVNQIKKFVAKSLNRKTLRNRFRIDHLFTEWSEYANSIYFNVTPAPDLSDKCLKSLAVNVGQTTLVSRSCVLYSPCYASLVNGSDFGYGLTHRMLLLLFAHNSANCSILSPELDQDLRDKFCAAMYDEAKYLAIHDFGDIDLLAEQIAICSLDGHAEFLREEWLMELLRYQTLYGCFTFTLDPSKEVKTFKISPKHWRLQNEFGNWMLNGRCNGHVTAVAAATLSAAVRYLLETVL